MGKRFGIQLHSKTILLEYSVPRYGLRAHHTIQVDLDGPRVPDCKPSVADDRLCDTAVAEKLQQTHEPWLAGVTIEQLADLVGRIRSSEKQLNIREATEKKKRSKQQRVSRTPGRSPR